jgi:biphenyl-2,3-diol 1,2-dioxygenase
MDHFDLQLGHLVIGARKPADWAAFCTQTLGLPGPVANADDSQGWQVDEAAQRLIVAPSSQDDLLAVGLHCAGEPALDRLLARLRAAGLVPTEADPDLARARRVQRVHTLQDPAGNTVELCAGPQAAPAPFVSPAFPRGFVTGDQGLGHVVLVHHDLDAMEAFYAAVGFGVTERLNTKAGPIEVRGTFMHCNRRHHSLALFRLPSRKRIHHFMLQAADHVDVGRAFERAQAHKVPLSLSLGQHPDPDGTFSFYGSTPSGFDFEIGAGSKTIDPRGWEVERTTQTSSWGHVPQLRLKLRMEGALIAARLGG